MKTYKTPDVYVEELSLFPPSVAEVETAIPAFIGYTELQDGDKVTVGTATVYVKRIKSLLDFQTYFGGEPPVSIDTLTVDAAGKYQSVAFDDGYYMYDCLRLFYDNGGGDCYIFSIGKYTDTGNPNKDHFINGLTALKNYDEPTIILFPDAVMSGLISTDDLYSIQQEALKQCNELMDRFVVCDLKSTDTAAGSEFRNKIGINYLKYGASYTPWLKVNYAKNINYRDFKSKLPSYTLKAYTTDPTIVGIIDKLEGLISDNDKVETVIAQIYASTFPPAVSGVSSYNDKYNSLVQTFKASLSVADMQNLVDFIYSLGLIIKDLTDGTVGVKNASLFTDLGTIESSMKSIYQKMIGNERQLKAAVSGYTYQFNNNTTTPQFTTLSGTTKLKEMYNSTSSFWGEDIGIAGSTPASTLVLDTTNDGTIMSTMLTLGFDVQYQALNALISTIIATSEKYESNTQLDLYNSYSVYKNLVSEISGALAVVPPSGAMAGIYAMVDRDRGVWKAPANVSLASVIAPTRTFSLSETDALNIDVNAGKSINAIRSFTGKGTLVWGARTLAGNDNEWRYISVRRFFNMVEESVKKSTYWAVFEPNDAKLWVKVKAMIENYLINKWKEGALAGATPKDAFYVKCGLGITMSAQDILEGYLNVEIGMAVVRPAEFIVLKFSHKMQVS